MKNKLLSIGLMIIFISLGMLKDTIEIELNSIDDYKKLIELGIELDHHRTIKSVHAYATNDEIQLFTSDIFCLKYCLSQAFVKRIHIFKEISEFNNKLYKH